MRKLPPPPSNKNLGSDLRLELHAFAALSPYQLYAALALRARVFVLEQRCIFLDPDGLDLFGEHVLLWQGDELVGYMRLLPEGLAHEGATSFGRVVIEPEARGQGLARVMIAYGMERLVACWPELPIEIAAQSHLEAFYASLGFRRLGGPYILDGIDHLDMRRVPDARLEGSLSA